MYLELDKGIGATVEPFSILIGLQDVIALPAPFQAWQRVINGGGSAIFLVVGATTFASLLIGVWVHEAGHALAAWSVGLQPRIITLGRGDVFRRLRLFGAWLVIRRVPWAGSVLALPTFADQRSARAVFICGGVLGNFVLLLALAGASLEWPVASPALGVAAFWQAFIILITLLPIHSGSQPSDGLLLLSLRGPQPDPRSILHDMARQVIPSHAEPPAPMLRQDVAEALHQLFRPDRSSDPWDAQNAATALQALLRRDALPIPERILILAVLLETEMTALSTGAAPAELVAWSDELAALLGPERVELLRGMALVMNGQLDDGEALLREAYVKPQTVADAAVNCALLAQAAAARGDEAGARHWMNLARSLPREGEIETLLPRLEARLSAVKAKHSSAAAHAPASA